MKIGFFDSGIGGITVLYQALKILPQENYLYYADTANVPYGEKPKSEVRRLVFEAADFIAGQNVKALVVACNSATSAAIIDLRRRYDFPILGIEPAVKPAIEKSHQHGKRVLVLSTNLTLREEKYNNLIAKLDNEGVVDGLPLPGLVEFAERFEFDEALVLPYLKQQFAGYELDQYECVVLGCTHFPLYKDMVAKLLPDAHIIDGGVGTARNLKRILEEQALTGGGSGQIEYYNSGVKVADRRKLAQYNSLFDRLAKFY